MLPESTTIRLLPMEAICSLMRSCAPDPTATMAITAATPMMMPSMVSAERILLMRSARKAIFTLAAIFLVFISEPELLRARVCPGWSLATAELPLFTAIPVITAWPSVRSPPVTSTWLASLMPVLTCTAFGCPFWSST